MTVIFTIGHGTRTTDELVSVLDAGGVTGLIDVRRFPGSRRHPQFSQRALERDLPERGIAYEWWGEELGGRRSSEARSSRHTALTNKGFRAYADYMDTPAFRAALEQLEKEAAEKPLAIMCAETLWWRCHRKLISDALVLDGLDVVHLIDEKARQQHRPIGEMRRDDNGWPVYDDGAATLFED